MDYQPNSNRFKEEQKQAAEKKRMTKVVTGAVQVKPKSGARKFAEGFFAGDAASVKQHIRDEVIIPGAKELIWSVFTNALDMFLFPGGGKHKSKDRFASEFISYSSISSKNRGYQTVSSNQQKNTNAFNFDSIVFTSRGDAEMVLQTLREEIRKYGVVSVLDLYDAIDRSAPFTANKYGWFSLDNATVERTRGGGYVIAFPKAMAID